MKTTECTHLKTKLSVLDISLKALEDRIASLQESNNHLAGDLRALQDVYGVAKKRVDLLEDSLHVSCRSCWWSVETVEAVGGLLKLLKLLVVCRSCWCSSCGWCYYCCLDR